MTVNPGAGAIEGPTERAILPASLDKLARAYIATYHGPHGDAPISDAATGPVDMGAAGKLMSPNLLSAHYNLGRRRQVGETLVEVYPSDDPGGFGPAIQIVTDYATLLMDSVTVLLHRLGVAYKAIMNPILRVRRSPTGELLDIQPAVGGRQLPRGLDEAWIHIQLSSSVDPKAVAEARGLLPGVLADARQVALDSRALTGTLLGLANELDTDPEGRFPAADRKDVAALLRWLADGHFVLLGYQRCPVQGGQSSVDSSSRLGVLRLQGRDPPATHRQRRPAGARAGHDPQLPALRRVPLHRRGPRTPRTSGDRAPLRRAVHGRRDERQCDGDSADLAAGRRSDRDGAARSEPSGATAARHHPDHSALGALRAQLARAAGHGDGRRRPGLAPAHVVVPARRSARPLRLLPGVPAARPVHHGGPPRNAGHPRPRARRREHRIHRPGQRITLGSRAFHRSPARGIPTRERGCLAAQRGAHPGSADRGGANLGRPAARCRQDRVDRPGQGRALLERRSPRSTSRLSAPTTRSTTSRSSKSCRTIRSSWCSPRTAGTARRS